MKWKMLLLLKQERHALLRSEESIAASIPYALEMALDMFSAAGMPAAQTGAEEILVQSGDPEEMVHAIRQLQILFQGFSRGLTGFVMYPVVGVVLESASGQGNSSQAVLRAQLLRFAKPGTVLLTEGAHGEMKKIPGLSFAQPEGDEWNSPWWEMLPPDWLKPVEISPPVLADASSSASLPRAAASTIASSTEAEPNRFARQPSPEAEEKTSVGRKLTLVAATGVAAVGLIAFALHERTSSKAAPASAPFHVPPPTVTTPGATSPPAAGDASKPVPRKPGESKTAAAAANPSAPLVSSAPAVVSKRSTKELGNKDESGVATARSSEYSAEDVRHLIDIGNQYSGDGHYDEAIQYFQAALSADPRNVEARRGLTRAKQNKNMEEPEATQPR